MLSQSGVMFVIAVCTVNQCCPRTIHENASHCEPGVLSDHSCIEWVFSWFSWAEFAECRKNVVFYATTASSRILHNTPRDIVISLSKLRNSFTMYESGNLLKSTSFWHVVPCNPVEAYGRFGGTCSLHIQGWRVSQARNQLSGYMLSYKVICVCIICVYIIQVTRENLRYSTMHGIREKRKSPQTVADVAHQDIPTNLL
jgi:hypothetical protein